MSDATAEHTVPAEHSDDAPATPPYAVDANGSADRLPPAVVKGRIKVADEVVEKVAALAAMEVAGVADMGGDLARAFESVRERIGVGFRRGTQGVSAEIQDRQVAIDLTIVVEYGHVVMEVAGEVRANVARSVSRMLGMRVMEVNVTVDDVRLPGEGRPTAEPIADDPF